MTTPFVKYDTPPRIAAAIVVAAATAWNPALLTIFLTIDFSTAPSTPFLVKSSPAVTTPGNPSSYAKSAKLIVIEWLTGSYVVVE